MRNVAKNFFYQSIFQLTKILIPIITVPIVSKAIGPQGIGMYNYSFSIAQYFVLMGGLGVTLYGNREIALKWHKKEDISKTFWEIFIFKAVITLIALLLYFTLIIFLDNKEFFLVQSITVLSVLFDISWFFMGIEDFKKTSMINLVVQIITFSCILLFVKTADDTIIYTFIQVVGILLSQIFVWFFVKEYIHLEKFSLRKSMAHMKGSIEYFIPQVAIMFYTNINKTILGVFLGSAAVGYFSNSLQLNNVFITIITTIDIVLLPHMSGLFAKNNISKIVDLMENTLHFQLFFSIPIMFGILTVYDKLIPWFFGDQFLFINQVVPFFSILIVIIPLGMSISRQYLMPVGKVREYNKSVLVGAVINILLNLLLLPTVGFFGVVMANIVAEIFVTLVRSRSFINDTNFKFDIKKIIVFICSAVVMCAVTRYITKEMNANIITNLVQLVIAVPIYFLLTSLLKQNPIVPLIKKMIK
ncbi:oligosaccharide flippase family protein [Enterococcus devriesei]|uniref:oligosaccharide flippase family protein n=1 Tax=Enterococcus devriesei TaxID=319970 RepID=UPI00288FA1C7|nr:oligosaccharide flippase family protein [Enterococcus devriesei]MDT2822156.1 oligosaccharide flippase family protein [Enterococcus devriesei]